MSGTRAGGLAAKAKLLKRDPLFYAKIGRLGGQGGNTGGFAGNPERARLAGMKGGPNGKPFTKKPRPVDQ